MKTPSNRVWAILGVGAVLLALVIWGIYALTHPVRFSAAAQWGGKDGWGSTTKLDNVTVNKDGELVLKDGKKQGTARLYYHNDGKQGVQGITWNQNLPSGATVTLQARSGGSEKAADSAVWTPAVMDAPMSLETLTGPYYELQITLKAGDKGATPVVRGAGITFTSPPNAASRTSIWTGKAGDGKWSTPGNWSNLSVPGGSDAVTFDSTSPAQTVTVDDKFGDSVHSLVLRDGWKGTLELKRSLNVTDVVIQAGTFKLNDQVLVVSGRYDTKGGTVIAGTSTVRFSGDTPSLVMTANTFYNLEITAPGKRVFFAAGGTQTVEGNFTAAGAKGNLVQLRSLVPGRGQWNLLVKGKASVSFVWLGDANNIGPDKIKAAPSNSYGNNAGFDTDPVWVGGGGDNNWSTAGNWDTGIVPGSSDTVTFNGSGTSDSTVDSGFAGTVAVMNVSSGYTGTITQARSLTVTGAFTQAAGTLTTADNDLTLGSVSLAGGTLNAGASTVTVAGNWSNTGGTFNKGTSTATLNGASLSTTIASNNQPFYNVTVSGTDYGPAPFIDDFETDKGWSLEGRWHLDSGSCGNGSTTGMAYSNGCEAGYGNNEDANAVSPSFYLPAGSKSLTFDSKGATEANFDFLYVDISTDNGSNYTNIWAGSGSWNWTTYTVDASAYSGTQSRLRLRFHSDGSYSGSGAVVDNVQLGTSTPGYVGTLSSDLTVSNNLTVSSGELNPGAYGITAGNFIQSGGIFTAPGSSSSLNVSHSFDYSAGTFNLNGGTLTLNGSGDSTGTLTTGGLVLNNLAVNGSGSTYTLQDDLSLAGNLSVSDGTLDTNSGSPKTVTVGGSVALSGGSLNANSSTINLTGSWTNSGGTFNKGTSTVSLNGPSSATVSAGGTGSGKDFYNLTGAGVVTADSDIISHWAFDDGSGTSAADTSGGSHNGTLYNTPTWTTGHFSGALQFNGSNQYVEVPDNSAYDLTSYSLSAWVKLSVSTEGRIISQQDGSGYWVMGIENGHLRMCDSNMSGSCQVTPQTVNDGSWHLVTTVRNAGTDYRYYIDGALVKTVPDPSGSGHSISAAVDIGHYIGNSEYYTGALDDVRVYNRNISQAEVGRLYQYGTLAQNGSYAFGSDTAVSHALSVTSGTVSAGDHDLSAATFAISGGTFVSSGAGHTFSVATDWNNAGGTFTHNNGAVVLTDSAGIHGDTTFNDLQANTSGKTLTFDANSRQTVRGALKLLDSAAGTLSLVSSSPGTQWKITPLGTKKVANASGTVSVADSNVYQASAIFGGNTGDNANITLVSNDTNWGTGDPDTLSLTAPTGSEQWKGGDSHDITWSYTGADVATVNLYYSADNGATWNLITSPSTSDTSYSWTIPTTITSAQAKIKVEIVDGNGYVIMPAISDALTIDSTAPASPTNVTVTGGDTQNVLSWTNPTDGGSGLAGIYIYRSTTQGAAGTLVHTTGPTDTTWTDTGLTNLTAYYYSLEPFDNVGNVRIDSQVGGPYGAEGSTSGLWHLDESSVGTFADSSGNGHGLTATGTVNVAAGVYGNGVHLTTGSNAPYDAGYLYTPNTFPSSMWSQGSVEFWYKADSDIRSGYYSLYNSSDYVGLSIDVWSGALQVGDMCGGMSSWAIPANWTGQWHHLAVSWNGSNTYLYVDNVLKGTYSNYDGCYGVNDQYYFGGYQYLGYDPEQYYTPANGTFDEFRISNTARTDFSAMLQYRGYPNTATESLTAPVGGEHWGLDATNTIAWTSGGTGINSIGLDYSADGGSNWTSIATGLSDTGSYVWVPPASRSTNAKIRVTAYDVYGDAVATSQSLSAFTYDGNRPTAPTNIATSIDGGTSHVTTTWTVSGDAHVVGNRIYRSTTQGSKGTLLTDIADNTTASYDDTTSAYGTTYYYTVISYNDVGTESSASPIDANTIGYWSFDEGSGSTAHDTSGQGHDGTLYNTPTWVAGQGSGTGMQFNGSNQYIQTGNISLSGPFTFDFWIKPSLHDYGDPISLSTGDAYFTFVTAANGSMTFGPGNGSSWGNLITTAPGVLANNTWYYISGTYSGTQTQLFVNGVSMGTASNSGYTYNQPLIIGSRPAPGYWYSGMVDNVRLSNVVRPASNGVYLSQSTVTPTDAAVTATSLAGGKYKGGTAHNITWTESGDGIDSVDLSYSTNNGSTYTSIATGQSDTGTYSWTMPGYTDSNQVLARIQLKNSQGVVLATGVSTGTFTIDSTPTAAPTSITGTSNGSGSPNVHLTWANPGDSDFAGIRIYRSTSSSSQGSLVQDIANTSTTSYDDAAISYGYTYYYSVTSYDDVDNESTSFLSNGLVGSYYNSNNFTNFVGTHTDPTVNFSWGGGAPNPPNGMQSDLFSVQWDGYVMIDTTENVTFYLTTDDSGWFYIDDMNTPAVTSGPGSPSSVTKSLSAGVHQVKIRQEEDYGGATAIWEYSSPTITRQVVPQNHLSTQNGGLSVPVVVNDATVTLTAPNGGQEFKGTSTQSVTWTDSGDGIAGAKLSYSADNGSTWTQIATNLTDTGTYSWTVPKIDTTQAKVKVDLLNGQGDSMISDVSDAAFLIDSTPPGPPTSVTAVPTNTPSTRVQLGWTNPADSDFAGIHIYRSTSYGTQGSLIEDTASTSTTSYDDTAVSTGTTYYYTVVSYDTHGNESVSSFADANTLALYTFGEGAGSTLHDTSGNGHDGSLQNSPTWVAGPSSDNALSFNGSNQYVAVGNLGSMPTAGTIEFWMQAGTLTSYPNPFSTDGNNGNNAIRFEENGSTFGVVVGDSNGNLAGANYTASMQASTWYHVALAWDKNANNIKGYWNGTKVFDQSQTYWPTSFPSLNIGQGFNGSRYWNGSMGMTRISNVARTQFPMANGTRLQIASTPNNASVSVTAPNGSEKYKGGTAHNVTWTASGDGISTVDLDYSADSGSTWTSVATGLSDSGSYSWTMPTVNSTHVRTRITLLNADGQPLSSDTSDADFTIDSTAPAAPTGFTAAPADSGRARVILNWTNPGDSDLGGIQVYRSTSATSIGSLLATVAGNSTTTYTDLAVSPASTYYYTLVSYDDVNNLGKTVFSVDSATKALWHFNDGSGQAAADISGNGNNGRLGSSDSAGSDDPTWTTGRYGSDLTFDGSTQYVYVPSNSSINPTSAITLEAWVKTTDSNGAIMQRYSTASGNPGYGLYVGVTTPGRLGMWVGAANSGGWVESGARVDDGSWHQVAGTYDGTNVRLYIDGVLDTTAPRTSSLDAGSTPLYLGKDGYNGGTYSPLAGELEGLRISNTARAASDLEYYYSAPAAAVIPADTPTSDPTGVSVAPVTGDGTQATITWTNPPEGNYAGADIYRSTVQGQLGTLVNADAPIVGTTYIDTGLTPGTVYYYVVKAQDEAGQESQGTQKTWTSQADWGDWSLTNTEADTSAGDVKLAGSGSAGIISNTATVSGNLDGSVTCCGGSSDPQAAVDGNGSTWIETASMSEPVVLTWGSPQTITKVRYYYGGSWYYGPINTITFSYWNGSAWVTPTEWNNQDTTLTDPNGSGWSPYFTLASPVTTTKISITANNNFVCWNYGYCSGDSGDIGEIEVTGGTNYVSSGTAEIAYNPDGSNVPAWGSATIDASTSSNASVTTEYSADGVTWSSNLVDAADTATLHIRQTLATTSSGETPVLHGMTLSSFYQASVTTDSSGGATPTPSPAPTATPTPAPTATPTPTPTPTPEAPGGSPTPVPDVPAGRGMSGVRINGGVRIKP